MNAEATGISQEWYHVFSRWKFVLMRHNYFYVFICDRTTILIDRGTVRVGKVVLERKMEKSVVYCTLLQQEALGWLLRLNVGVGRVSWKISVIGMNLREFIPA